MTLLEITVVLLVLVALAGLAIPYVGGTNQMAMCRATDATMQEIKRAIMGGPNGPGFYSDLLGQYPATTKGGPDFNLTYLLQQPSWAQKYNPKTAVGWRGPYLQGGRIAPSGLDASFTPTNPFDPATSSTFTNKVHESVAGSVQIMDAWNRPVILQVPCEKANATATACTLNYDYARLVSAGPGNGIQAGDAEIDTAITYVQGNIPDASDRSDDRVLYLKQPDPYQNGNRPCNEL